jgi:hypothetical protein
MSMQITYSPSVAKPIIGMVPPGGFHYFQGDVQIFADTIDELRRKVTEFRAENSIPNTTTVTDVNDYICGSYPDFCHHVDEVTISRSHTNWTSSELTADIQVWAKNILASPQEHPLVGDELAEVRAKICGGCIYNVNWKSGCSSCIASTERLSASIRQARDTQSTPTLGGCTVLRHDNRAAVFLQPEDLSKSSDIPKFCWLNK